MIRKDRILELNYKALRFYEEYFKKEYSFVKYDLIFVPNLTSRAMENAGCVTFNESLISNKEMSL